MLNFHEHFYYDELSKSCLKWKTPRHCKGDLRGKDAGSLDAKGYYRVKLDGKSYKVHRIIYSLFNKDFKYNNVHFIDHINRIRGDNRISNLRIATRESNARNISNDIRNSTGVTGVQLKRSSRQADSYRATWRDINGRPREKSFSVSKYGEELSFFMACEYREKMIQLLNLQGAGYTDGHGKPKMIEKEA